MGDTLEGALLEEAMRQALEGDEQAAAKFFRLFLSTKLFVPDRHQNTPLSNAPCYPHDLVSVLGVKSSDTVFVPVFTEHSYVAEWCGHPLTLREIEGQSLLKFIPAEWWISINPGREVEKELSSWEIDQLRGGEQGIQSILHDLFQPEPIETLNVRALKSGEHLNMCQALREFSVTHPRIKKLFMIMEEGRDIDGAQVNTLVVGAHVSTFDEAELDSVRDEIRILCEPMVIGAEPLKVLVGGGEEGGLLLGIFRGFQPIFER